jgi:hypothetical protein
VIQAAAYSFGKDYRRALASRDAENGFKNTGIYPSDRHICPEEEDYVVTDTRRDQQQTSNCD